MTRRQVTANLDSANKKLKSTDLNALDYAQRFIRFEKSSPVTGAFFIPKYRFLERPLLSLSDITKKRTVVYKASSCLGTVFMQIATAFHLDRMPGDTLFVAQTDDDATQWTKTRGKPFLERIPSLTSTLKNEKFSITNDLWLWPHQFLQITGPGINSQNSKQVRYVKTDEAHLYGNGTLAAFGKRMGARWDRHELHVSTAADQGKEIDKFYFEATQNEWHQRCPKCNELFWVLWREAAKKHYGHEIFQWKDQATDAMTLDTLRCICPLCDSEIVETPKNRRYMGDGGDYIPMNPNAPAELESFRWNCFSAEWIAFREILSEYLTSRRASRLGDMKGIEDFTKKRECRTWKNELTDTGDTVSTADYSLGAPWIKDMKSHMNMSIDVQEKGGFHLYAQVDEFCTNGDSRRQHYERLETWTGARDLQKFALVNDKNVHPDYGNRDREVFEVCAEYRWYPFKGSDEREFPHKAVLANGKKEGRIYKPFSEIQIQDPNIGKVGARGVLANGSTPLGICLSRLWSNPTIYPILYALKSGESGRYYGIASDIPNIYLEQLSTHVPRIEYDDQGQQIVTWICLKPGGDHAWDTSCMNITDAIEAGFFPMSFRTVEPESRIVASVAQ